MTENILARLIEHHNWATLEIFEACTTLSETQLDFHPQTAVYGTIREILQHIVLSQEDYVWMLTRFTHPPEREISPTFSDLRKLLVKTGETLSILVKDPSHHLLQTQTNLSDGYKVEPWVFITQIIDHAAEHREQIKSIISALDMIPPRVDGWAYARESNALIPPNAAVKS